MWKIYRKIFFFLILNQSSVKCEYFSIVGAKTLRIDRPYEVAVTSHSLNASTLEVLVAIEGVSYSGKKFKATENVEIGPGETKIADIGVRKCKL